MFRQFGRARVMVIEEGGWAHGTGSGLAPEQLDRYG